MDKVVDFLQDNLKNLISTGITIVICIVVMLVVKFTLGKIIRIGKKNKNRKVTLAKVFQSLIKYTVYIIGAITILSIWGFNVMPLLAGVGVIGLALAFGAQALIKDIVGGMAIIFENYYDIDDVVEIKGFKGKVTEISLKTTRIQNWKGELKIFSNGDIAEVTNFSRMNSVAEVTVEVSYNEKLDRVISVLEKGLAKFENNNQDVISPVTVLGVVAFNNSGIAIKVIVNTKPEQHYAIERELRKEIKELFDKNNIEIPYQQIVIHNGSDGK